MNGIANIKNTQLMKRQVFWSVLYLVQVRRIKTYELNQEFNPYAQLIRMSCADYCLSARI